MSKLRDAALAIVDEQGLDALTMRAAGFPAWAPERMTIYNYVDRRDGLDRLVTSAVWASAPPSTQRGTRTARRSAGGSQRACGGRSAPIRTLSR